MTFQDAKAIGSKTISGFQEHKVTVLSAAAAYYALFSLAPMLVIVTAVAGFFWQQQPGDAQEEVISEVEATVGSDAGGMLETMLENASASQGSGILATVLGVALLLYAAGTLIAHVQDSLNSVWGVRPTEGGFMSLLRVRLKAVGVMIGAGLLFLALTVANGLISGLSDVLEGVAPWLPVVARIVGLLVTIALFTVLIAAIFRVLPDAKLAWSDVWVGAAVTAVLLTLGTWAIGVYLSVSAPGSAYGAAGALVALIIWLYYTALIFFLGAEFTHAYVEHFGREPAPESYAERVDEAVA